MKILYITLTSQDTDLLHDSIKADYMSDLLFHGLRSVYGENVVDYPKKSHLYRGYQTVDKLWGKGFTYTNTLNDIPVDRDINDIKIREQYDLIVISVHHTIHSSPHYLYSLLEKLHRFTNSKIAVVDGHDLINTYDEVFNYTQYLFKREIKDRTDCIPISFAIPKEKIIQAVPKKTKFIANIIPANSDSPNRKTHSFNKEEDYYKDYQDSYFAFTCKKGGWDCLRHYEILANGCIPIFTDIENCPGLTLTTLPKVILSLIKKWPVFNFPKQIFTKDDIDINHEYINYDELNKYEYQIAASLLLGYTKKLLTTESLAKYFVRKIYENS